MRVGSNKGFTFQRVEQPNSNSPAARKSSIELLRIIAMIFIVLSHSSVHGCFPSVDSKVSLNNYFLDWLVLGNLGVDIFIIISGYFLSTKEFKIQSIKKLLAQVYFFSYFCIAVSFLLGNEVSFLDFVRSIFPVVTVQYWFFTVYIILLIFTPHINAFVKAITRKKLFYCLAAIIALQSVLALFPTKSIPGFALLEFVMFYCIGAYLRNYPDNILSVPTLRRALVGCSAFLLFLSSVVLRFFNNRIWSLFITETLFYSRTSILVICLAIGMVSIAIYHKAWTNKLINTISSCAFGVYLFHDNPLIRRILWPVLINNDAFYDSQILVFRVLLSVAMVYIIGTVIEFLRQKFFAKPMECFIDRVFEICFSLFKKRVV